MTGTSSVCRMCRQAGEKLFFKGARCRTSKCAIEKRNQSPGQHGKKAGTRKLSEFGKQLKEKQKVKFMYKMLEAQFRRFFAEATRQKGASGENLLSMLERRLDNVIYRLKMAISRQQARQMIVHGHVAVNGQRIESPSFLVKVGDAVTFAPSTLSNKEFVENTIDKRLSIGIKVPEWLELNKKDRKGIILRLPVRADITTPIEEHLIVEMYSK